MSSTSSSPARFATLILALLGGSLVFTPPTRAGKWEAIEKVPGQTPVVVLVEEKPRNYFRITSAAPLSLRLQGPGRLRITSRAEFPKGSPEIISYTLRAYENGHLLEEEVTESSPSKQSALENDTYPVGKSRRLVVDLLAGEHAVELRLEGPPSLLVRFQQAAPAKGEEPMVTLTPHESPRSLMLTEGEKTIPYYSVMPGRPVKLKVIGPTTLDLITRLDFDATMRGTQSYSLAILEGKKKLREVEFKTTKATTAAYADKKDLVPSKFDRFQLSIGEGTHELSIELIAPARGSVEIHPRIPEPATGNEE